VLLLLRRRLVSCRVESSRVGVEVEVEVGVEFKLGWVGAGSSSI
jgi:hypothetical protein